MGKIKLRVDSYVGEHVTVTMFGTHRDQDTLANHGTLVMHPDEWRVFRTMMRYGAREAWASKVVVDEDVFLAESAARRAAG